MIAGQKVQWFYSPDKENTRCGYIETHTTHGKQDHLVYVGHEGVPESMRFAQETFSYRNAKQLLEQWIDEGKLPKSVEGKVA